MARCSELRLMLRALAGGLPGLCLLLVFLALAFLLGER